MSLPVKKQRTKYASTNTEMLNKDIPKAEFKKFIDEQMELFLDNGGMIEYLPDYIPPEVDKRENERCRLEISAYRQKIKERLEKEQKE